MIELFQIVIILITIAVCYRLFAPKQINTGFTLDSPVGQTIKKYINLSNKNGSAIPMLEGWILLNEHNDFTWDNSTEFFPELNEAQTRAKELMKIYPVSKRVKVVSATLIYSD